MASRAAASTRASRSGPLDSGRARRWPSASSAPSSGIWRRGAPDRAMARAAPPEERLRREIEHHRELAGRHTEEIWGWDSPAGRVRADRRARLFVELGRLGPGARVLEL